MRSSARALVALLLLLGTACPSSKPHVTSPVLPGASSFVKPGTALLSVPARDPAAAYRRPLRLKHLKPGQACPITTGRVVSDERVTAFALGPGPVYQSMDAAQGVDGAFHYASYPLRDAWHDVPSVWLEAPSVTGDVLLRGLRLDGPGSLGVSPGEFTLPLDVSTSILSRPSAALIMPAVPTQEGFNLTKSGWRNYRGAIDLQEPGCYGVQIDGSAFSYTIIFRAVP